MKKDKKYKVLLCSSMGHKVVGGITRWTGNVMSHYNTNVSESVELHLFSTETGNTAGMTNLKRWSNGLVKYIGMLRALRHSIAKNEINLVHVVSSGSFSLLKDLAFISVAGRKKVKTVVHFHFGRIPEIFETKHWEYKLLHRIIGKADTAIVIDKKSYDTLMHAGYKNIRLLPNPLTPTVTGLIEKNKHILRKERTLLFAGQTIVTKGVYELINACKTIPDIHLKMIGHVFEEMKTNLLAQAGEGHERWLSIAGEQDFETTIKEMLSCGVFVLPTYTEGFPNVIIESMACGCPIVTTNVGAIPEMLDIDNGDNYGLWVEPKNAEKLRGAILRMLNDKDFAARCGANAQNRVNEKYGMPKILQQIEEIWLNS
ncbi:glycosyltransferase family 4 protein [Kaistella rhinocerotis]|uniref:glycosyltransferase family 4 protein n=1 Tax=Kaistella rhinocerotis TaxID=3026437 RepID=UPI002552483E|nr:glycosyltransferase family 4 protein [Kaistella sp. Ran72]